MKTVKKSEAHNMTNAELIGTLVWANGVFRGGKLLKWQSATVARCLNELAARGVIDASDAARLESEWFE